MTVELVLLVAIGICVVLIVTGREIKVHASLGFVVAVLLAVLLWRIW